MTLPSSTVTLTSPGATPSLPRPLFGGYALVAGVAAWLVGIALRGIGPLAGIAPPGWLIAAGVALLVWVGTALLGRLTIATRAPRTIRALLMGGLLAFFVALGAARAASADPTTDPHAVSRFATNQSVRLQGEVATEPDLRDGARILTVAVSQVSSDGGHTWQLATGRVEATVFGPDDWFSPAYGDGVSLTGTLRPLGSGYAPARACWRG